MAETKTKADDVLDLDELDAIASEKADEKPKAKTTKAAPRRASSSSLEGQLREMFMMFGGLVSAWDQFDGSVIQSNADDLASNLDTLAKANPKARAFLERMLSGGAWSGVVMVLGVQVVLPIAVHHGAGGAANPTLAAALNIPVKTPKPRKAKPARPVPPGRSDITTPPDDGDIDPAAPFTVTDPAAAVG